MCSPVDIENMRQNHPELVVRDLVDPRADKNGVLAARVRWVLKYRGVNKWLRVRRLLIQLKNRWRDDINRLEAEAQQLKAKGRWREYHKLRGYLKALHECRAQVRVLCHSPRDVDFPDDPHEFGPACKLPTNLPKMPHKRWLRRNGTP